MAEDGLIVFDHVHKSFGDLEVLRDINCAIERGETTVFIGPSGVGKSVLLKHIVGLHLPDKGRVLVGGEDITRLTGKGIYRVRRRMGMLFQGAALFDSMSVYENVAFPLRHHTRKSEREIRAVVEEKLARVGLPGVEEKFPSELSGGMKKRVGLARAIVLEPDVVLFDEPTSGLDPVIAASIDQLIMDMQRELGLTFVVISHDVETTRKVAHKIGMLYQSRLIAFGARDDILNSGDPVLKQFFSRSTQGPMRIV